MARPAKPANVIKMEHRKAHRSKQELAIREKAEKELMGGEKIKERPEVKADSVAHKEFIRLRKLFLLIDKDDDLYGDALNTMAKLTSEIMVLEGQQANVISKLDELNADDFDDKETYWKLYVTLQEQYAKIETRIDNKRKLRFNLEKENCMTIAAALRAIPKTPKEANPLKEALYGS